MMIRLTFVDDRGDFAFRRYQHHRRGVVEVHAHGNVIYVRPGFGGPMTHRTHEMEFPGEAALHVAGHRLQGDDTGLGDIRRKVKRQAEAKALAKAAVKKDDNWKGEDFVKQTETLARG